MQAPLPSLLLRSYQPAYILRQGVVSYHLAYILRQGVVSYHLAYILKQGVVSYHLAYILKQGVDKVAFSGRRSGSWAAAINEGIPT